ncbi:MAG: thioesterase family protein [Gammaproteobacteria bacterium]|nr:thioesterase family protein [Gammaproteobacteria bacterium]
MPKPFTLLLRVRYAECDYQGVVFNSRYVDMADVAATEFFRVLFGDYQNILDQGLDSQVVKLSTEWQASAKFDDVLALEVNTARVGNSSYQLDVDYINHQSGQVIARTEITYVMVDSKDYRPTAVPDAIRESLTAGADGIIIDQTGTHSKRD